MVLLSILGGMTLLALALVLVPLLRSPGRTATRGEADLRIYRDQLAELEAETARGAIGATEADAARREIERRIVRTVRLTRSGPDGTDTKPEMRRSWRRLAVPVGLALALPLAAGLLYAKLGAAGAIGALPWQPSAAQREVADFNVLLQRLEAKVRAEPDRPEGWALLGRMYDAAHRFPDATQAFDRAAMLRPDNADLKVAAAESRILAADGTVTPDAKAQIDQALAIDPHHPGARYYRGLGQWQGGDRKTAYATWRSLLADSPTDAPWLPDLRARLAEAANTLGLAPPAQLADQPPGPDATDMARAARMTPEQRQDMIRSMVATLAARLQAEPNDLGGWMRLGRSYAVLGEPVKAVDAFEHAGKLAPNDPDVLVGLAQARGQAGDRAGALAALGQARSQLAPDDPRRDQIDQTMRAFQPAPLGKSPSR